MSMTIPPIGAPGGPVPGAGASPARDGVPHRGPSPDRHDPVQAPSHLDLARANLRAATAGPADAAAASRVVAGLSAAIGTREEQALAAQANLSPDVVAWLLRPE